MRSRAVAAFALLSLGVPLQLLTQQRHPQPRTGSIDIAAALVIGGLEVRPVPLLSLEIWSARDSSTRTTLRTGLNGQAVFTGTAGPYHLRSAKTPIVDGKAYTWLVDFVIAPGKVPRLELTNANAQIESTTVTAPAPGRAIAPEMALYERLRDGVLQVRADLSSGSGFMVDTLDGIVLTNAHVVSGAEDISVVFQSGTRVAAQLLAKSEEADVAVLRLPKNICSGCPRLRLARPDTTGKIVLPGERVLA